MTKNVGKIFEEDFRISCPDYCFVERLKDSAQAYNNSENTKYSWNNKCDYFIYDNLSMLLYALELKSTKSKSISWQVDKNDKSQRMIKYHQINALFKISKFNHIISGFIFNYRDEVNNTQRTYFQYINDFIKMKNQIGKKSCDEIDILLYNAIKISGFKKRTRWHWNIDEFIQKINNVYGGK